jgi:hypothetical protein
MLVMFSFGLLAALALLVVQAGSASADQDPEIKVSKHCPNEVDLGDTFECTISIEADYVPDGAKIELKDNVPSGLDTKDVDVSGDGNDSDCEIEGDGDVECEFGPLYEDYVDITVKIEFKAEDCGTHTNTVYVELKSQVYDGSDSDSDSVKVECDNKITISKDTDPEDDSHDFDFESSLGDFSLEDDESKVFTNVDDGTYTFTEDHEDDWDLTDIVCSGSGHWVIDEDDREVKITVDGDEEVTCEFNNEKEEDEKDEPAPKPPVTIFLPLPAPQPPAPPPPPPPPPPVAALPRTGDGPQETGFNLALPAGVSAALLVAGVGYAFARRQRDAS